MAICKGCKTEKATNVRTKYVSGEVIESCDVCAGVRLQSYEFVPERIKEDRKKYFNSTLQPYRDGVASKEFVEAYPQKSKEMFTRDQIKSSKYIWKDLSGWDTRHQSL